MVSRTIGRAAVLLALGGLLLAASPGAGGDGHPKEQAAAHDKHAAKGDHAEHKLTAADEVSDQDEKWYISHDLGIYLPLVGWFKIGGYPVPTKYMWLMLIAAVLTFVIYRGLARRVQNGEYPRGPLWNFFESLLTFIRDEVAKPNFPEHANHEHEHAHESAEHHGGQRLAAKPPPAPEHPADRFVPLLWTLFIYLLFCNLLGLVPFMGSPTANIFMTGGVALIVFIIMHGAALLRMGGWGYIKAMWPKIDLPYAQGNILLTLPLNILTFVFKNLICFMIFSIELISSVIKSGVLAIRLFANMFAGHMVVASILMFIVLARDSSLWGLVTVASVLGVIALSLLELFVAFLQAYIFTFLTALFIGMAVNPEH
jgi:F-type H+-transporting ATPase subunit a